MFEAGPHSQMCEPEFDSHVLESRLNSQMYEPVIYAQMFEAGLNSQMFEAAFRFVNVRVVGLIRKFSTRDLCTDFRTKV